MLLQFGDPEQAVLCILLSVATPALSQCMPVCRHCFRLSPYMLIAMQVTPDVDDGVEIVEPPPYPQSAKPSAIPSPSADVLHPDTPPQAADRPARRRFAGRQQHGGTAVQQALALSARKRRCVAADMRLESAVPRSSCGTSSPVRLAYMRNRCNEC